MAIDLKLIDQLLADYKKPEDMVPCRWRITELAESDVE